MRIILFTRSVRKKHIREERNTTRVIIRLYVVARVIFRVRLFRSKNLFCYSTGKVKVSFLLQRNSRISAYHCGTVQEIFIERYARYTLLLIVRVLSAYFTAI